MYDLKGQTTDQNFLNQMSSAVKHLSKLHKWSHLLLKLSIKP